MAEGEEEFVYRISGGEEWQELQNTGSTLGGELDKSSGFIHLSKLNQVQSTLQNFFLNTKGDLYLLQIDAKKLGKGLVYEIVDGSNKFPHFYGPSRSFSPLSQDAITKAEKLTLSELQRGKGLDYEVVDGSFTTTGNRSSISFSTSNTVSSTGASI